SSPRRSFASLEAENTIRPSCTYTRLVTAPRLTTRTPVRWWRQVDHITAGTLMPSRRPLDSPAGISVETALSPARSAVWDKRPPRDASGGFPPLLRQGLKLFLVVAASRRAVSASGGSPPTPASRGFPLESGRSGRRRRRRCRAPGG